MALSLSLHSGRGSDKVWVIWDRLLKLHFHTDSLSLHSGDVRRPWRNKTVLFFDGQTDGQKNVRQSVRIFFFFFDAQTDRRKNVRLSVRIFFFVFDGQTDGWKNVRQSVRIFYFFLTDRQTDKKMSVCLSGIFFFFFFFFFFFDGQTDGRKNVRLSVRFFFFFFWRTDRRTKNVRLSAPMQMHCA